MNLVLSLSLVLATAPASATGAVAGGAVSEELAPVSRVERVDLEVDHSALLEHQVADAAEDSAYFVLEDATKALTERHRVQVVDDAEAPRIVVRLGWKDYENSVYWIAIATQRPGREPEIMESFEAKCIDSTALSEAVVGRLRGALERLGEEKPVPDAVVEVKEPDEEPPEPTDPEPVDREEKRIGAAGYAGIASLTLGLGLGIGGVFLAVEKPKLRPHPTDDQSFEQVSRRPLGYGLTAAGASLLVTGVVLVAVDQTVLRKRRARGGSVAVIVPTLLPTGAGLVFVRRF